MSWLLLLLFGIGSTSSVAFDGGSSTPSSNYDAGQLDFRVYSASLPDGGTAPVYIAPDGTFVQLDQFVCAKRVFGVPPNALGCFAKFTDGGDYGQDNVMQPGMFQGTGCTKTPCAIFYGDAPP